jgi:hypothetical protein
LTLHDYGWTFYYGPTAQLKPTVEGRLAFIGDWIEWDDQLRKGHPIFDLSLESACDAAIRAIKTQLADLLSGTVAAMYLNPALRKGTPTWDAAVIVAFDIVMDHIDNWPAGTKVDRVAVAMYRPGIPHPRSGTAEDSRMWPNHVIAVGSVYREEFHALDLDVQLAIETPDEALRRECFAAERSALSALRTADSVAASER